MGITNAEETPPRINPASKAILMSNFNKTSIPDIAMAETKKLNNVTHMLMESPLANDARSMLKAPS